MTEADHALTSLDKKNILTNPFNYNYENVDRSMSMTKFYLG